MATSTLRPDPTASVAPDFVTIAIAHAAAGRAVFPWKLVTEPGKTKPTKQPLVRWQDEATTDERRIIDWAKRYPNARVGWRLPEGLAIVDVDDPDAFAAAGLELPDAPEQRGTLRGASGLHRLYRVDNGRQTQGDLPGVDTRVGGAGWVALYSERAFAGEPPPAPAWFPRGGAANGTLDHPSGFRPGAPLVVVGGPHVARQALATDRLYLEEGKRDGGLASIAGTLLAAGATPEATEIALGLIHAAGGVERVPGDTMGTADFRRIARSMSRKDAADRSGGVDEIEPGLASAATAMAPEAVDASLVAGYARPASLVVLAAPEGVGKTRMAIELAIRGATGTGMLHGRYPIPTSFRVAYVDEENGEPQLWREEEAVRMALGLERSALSNLSRVSFAGMHLGREDRQGWLLEELRRERPDLVILDTGGVMVDDEWGAGLKDGIRFLRSVTRELGCAFLVLVHMTKPNRSGRGEDRVHGTALSDVMGQWTRHADVVVTALDLGADRVRLAVRKRIEPSTVILARSGGLWAYVAEADATGARASVDDRILRAIAAGAEAADEIRQALGVDGRTLAKRTFYDALRRLRLAGLVGDGVPLQLTDAGAEAVA